LFGDDVLIVGVNVALFFQGKDFIIRLGMVVRVLAAVVGSFLLLVAFFPLLLRACWITVVTLLVVSTILIVLVVAILLVVAVAVVVPIIAAGIVGIYSFWVARVTTFGILQLCSFLLWPKTCLLLNLGINKSLSMTHRWPLSLQ
jgi:hypothetical protein